MRISSDVDCRKCCQLSLADDRRQFITLSVYFCVHHDVVTQRVARVGLHLQQLTMWFDRSAATRCVTTNHYYSSCQHLQIYKPPCSFALCWLDADDILGWSSWVMWSETQQLSYVSLAVADNTLTCYLFWVAGGTAVNQWRVDLQHTLAKQWFISR